MSNSKIALAVAGLLLVSVSSFASEAGDRALALAASLNEDAAPAAAFAKSADPSSPDAVANAVKAQSQASGLKPESNASKEAK